MAESGNWLESIYSDGSGLFVSDPAPGLFDTVTVRLRIFEDAPVRHVYLRSLHNGMQEVREMRPAFLRGGLRYYECPLKITETRIQYQFYIAADGQIYYYTQRGVTTYLPDNTYDFVLLADYVQPAWVRESVFYQIFPERFYNGDRTNDVADGEYLVDGRPTIHVADWSSPPMDYERGRCADFYGGDLAGVREKLPYLKRLGVTAIYLNPIFTAPSVHKYDCIDYFHVDPHFGGDGALAELTAAAHALGIRVILDISINHTGCAHRWFNRDGEFFPKSEGAYNNPDSRERDYYFFGPGNTYHAWAGVKSLPTLNYTSDSLRDEVYRGPGSLLRKWLRAPYSIDGWRFDVADTFGRRDDVQLAHRLWPEIRRAIREEAPQAYILAEDWGDCAGYLQGGEWDSPMNYFSCARPIRRFFGQADHFVDRIPGLRELRGRMPAEDLAQAVTQHYAKLPWALQENQFNLIDSHDISRLHNDPEISFAAWRCAVIFQFILPGAASIYYGDEAGIGGTLGTNEGCRWPMPWDTDIEGTESFEVYSALCRLKRESSALKYGGMKILRARENVFAMARFTGDEAVAAVISNSPECREVTLDLSLFGALTPEGERDALGRPLPVASCRGGALKLSLEPEGGYIFTCRMA